MFKNEMLRKGNPDAFMATPISKWKLNKCLHVYYWGKKWKPYSSPQRWLLLKWVVNFLLDKIDKFVGPFQILETYNRNAIISEGYNVAYKTFKCVVKFASNGWLEISCLFNPH